MESPAQPGHIAMRKESTLRFFVMFAVGMLGVITTVCALFAFLRYHSIQNQAEHEAGVVSTHSLAPVLASSAGQLSRRDLANFTGTAGSLIGGDLVAIRLWAPDGTLLAQAGEGAAPINSASLRSAGAGALGATKERATSGDVLATYMPILPGAILEVQQDYAPVAATISSNVQELAVALAIGAVLLAFLLPLVLVVTMNSLKNEFSRLQLLHKTGQSVRETLDLVDMLAHFSRDVVIFTGSQLALAALVEETGDIIVKASYNGLTKTSSHHYRKVEEWYLRRCAGTGGVIQSREDKLPYETILGYDPALRGKGNLLCVPIPGRQRVAGLVMLVRFAAQGSFKPAEVQMVSEMAALTAMAVEQATLFAKVQSYAEEVEVGYDSTLKVLTAALDTKDTASQGHSERVARLTLMLAREVGVPNNQLVDIERGALLHDVGKIGVPDEVLNKPAALTDDDWEQMQKHPLMAGLMVSKVGFLEGALPILLYHHEHFDGTGYPFGLEGTSIPLEARIFMVVDAFDAMTSDRPYRAALDAKQAMAEIVRNSGTQFDPAIVDAFVRVIERVRAEEEQAA